MNKKCLTHFALALSALLSIECVHGSDHSATLEALKKEADQGNANAQYQLAIAYNNGDGVAIDKKQAVAWCRKAAEQGLAEAQNCVGSTYQSGDGVEKDYVAAVFWYQKAQQQGYAEACVNLGYMYDLGLGIEQDRVKAVELYRQGAEKGSLNGMLDLAISYMDGSGTEVDLVESYKWLELARFYTQQSSNMKLKWHVRHEIDDLKKRMSKIQIKEAEQRAKEWDRKHR
jgi:TPR repeat protein